MAYCYLVVVLSTIIMAYPFNAVQGSPSFSIAKTESDQLGHITESTIHVKDDANPNIENFSKLIKKHVDEIKKFRSLHPDIDGNKQLSLRINEILQDHFKRVMNSHIKGITDNDIDAKHSANPTIENFNRLIEKHVDEIKKFRSLHSDIDGNRQLSSGINEIIQDLIKRAVNSHINDRIRDVINPERFSDPTSYKELASLDSISIIHNGVKNEDVKKQSNERSHSGKKKSEYRTKYKSNDRSIKGEIKGRGQIKFLVHDINGMVNELKSTITGKDLAKKTIIESKLSKKFDMLRKISQHSTLTRNNNIRPNDNNNEEYDEPNNIKSHEGVSVDENIINEAADDGLDDSTKNPDVAETDVHRALRNKVLEKLATIITNLQSSEQAFIKSKEEMSSAAKKLHLSTTTDIKSSRNHGQGRTFDIQSMSAFKSKLHEMILKKTQYIREKVSFQLKLKQTLNNSSLAYSKSSTYHLNTTAGTSPSDIDEHQKVTANAISNNEDDWHSSQNYVHTTENSDREGLKMAAAGYRNAESANDEEGSSTVVVVVVLACLVISAVVGVFVVVVWRKYHRHRLYVRIPGEHAAPASQRYNN